LIFLLVALFALSLSILLFEITLTRMFSIILWYNYAFMAISIAFFGLGIGALVIHLIKHKIKTENLPSKILQSSIAFAISLPVFLFLIGYTIPPSTSFIYLFFLVASTPFFFAGMSMALIYLAMPRKVTKLYFVDLAGAAGATLILDSLLQGFGAESLILLIGILVTAPLIIASLSLYRHKPKDYLPMEKKLIVYGIIFLSVSTALLGANFSFNILAIPPGENKGLNSYLSDPSNNKHLSAQWNSFSRIDVIGHNDIDTMSRTIDSILIDADALTPLLRWNGSIADIQWLKQYMDYMPFEISSANNNTLVIGSGGGEDILVALAGGAKNVTAVELNPLIISAAKRFGGSLAGNLYDRKDVHLFIDDGRRFISSTNSKYDKIVIKLVDSWAAQLAGGYALSENYLYTVEAFKQYLQHLNGDNGMLVMVRWNIELPRLMPLVVESLKQQEAKGAAATAGGEGRTNSVQDISKQIVVVEDRPGLTFGSNNQRTEYPVLVMVKNSPFTNSELDLIKAKVARNDAKVIAMPAGYVQPPYDRLLLPVSNGSNKNHQQSQQLQQQQPQPSYDPQQLASFSLKPPTDDSPFYFAKEQIPTQLLLLIETVTGVSAVLAFLLVYYSKVNKIRLTTSSRLHVVFVILIGLGFIFLEITFIQKFLLLLGTPIMALTVILFSILLSSGIGAYLSGRLFNKNPYKAIVISIPILTGILLAYYVFLQYIISFSIVFPLYERIALTFALLSPAGLLMGFQFPSITRMASDSSSHLTERRSSNQDITLLWGVNVIASVIGTVLTTTSSMVIGFSGNLLIGFGLYLAALASAIAAIKISQQVDSQKVVK
jgi:predicted membrane-bound spermidine synthase